MNQKKMRDYDGKTVRSLRELRNRAGGRISVGTLCRVASSTNRGLTIVALLSGESMRNVPRHYVELLEQQ